MQDSQNSSPKSANISSSSVETQRELRIQKMHQLTQKGHNPFTPNSKRDFTLGFVKFWFDFAFKFDLKEKLQPLNDLTESGLVTFSDSESFLCDLIFEPDEELIADIKENMDEALKVELQKVANTEDKKEIELAFRIDEERIRLLAEARKLLGNQKPQKINEDLFQLVDNFLIELAENENFQTAIYPQKKVTLAGRIKSKRVSGKIAFATLEDESCPDGFQFIFKKDDLAEEKNERNLLTFDDFKELFDEGDYIQATGKLEYSQRGEPSLLVEEFEILTKALRPLPEKLEDKELRFRQRYVDMLMHPEVRELFRQKGRFWTATKEFMDDHSFTQVFAPVMQETTGGAEANPFVTHHNALDEDFYLGISPELHLKRMVVGGLEKIYDLGRNFRNEGIDDDHLQEFNRIEFYWAFASHDDLMNFTEELVKYALEKAFGKLQLIFKKKDEKGEFTGEEILVDWSQKWPRMPYYDFIQHFSGIDLREYKEVEDLKKLARELEIHFEESAGFGRLTDLIYKKVARPKCIEPVWMTDVPTRLSPLAKRDPKNPENTLRSHLLAYGSELSNGFAELNDPLDQLDRFLEQQAARDAGDDEAMMIDMDFVQALEIGLPPTVGFAYSDRLFDLVANKTMREATPFPLMRRLKENVSAKSKKTMVVHCLILDTPQVPMWSKLNAAAHLSAAFAARVGKKLIHIEETTTMDGEKIPMNIQHAIMMKKTENKMDLLELKQLAEKSELMVTVFTEEMRESSNDEKVKQKQEQKTNQEIGYLGILIFGEKKAVEKLTAEFAMFE